MTKIKTGDIVSAHLNPDIKGRVVKVLQERSNVWTSSGPMTDETFCIVEISDGRKVKVKASDLYVVYG